MSRPPTPVFLERKNYRLRRLRDAARLLPVLGALLFLVPLMWARDAAGGVASVRAVLYVFGVWAVLIAAAALLARPLAQRGDPAPATRRPPESEAGG